MSVKCVCIGTDPGVAMECALLGYDLGELTSHFAGLGRDYACAANIANTYFTCSRRKGHAGPCVACLSNGYNEPDVSDHNLTNVTLPE